MSGETPESHEPEPIEDRIARVITETLEPFVVSLLAALIAPSQCVQGIDRDSEDQRRRAIELGRMLLDESRTRLKAASDQIKLYGQALEAHKQQQLPSPGEDWLYLDMKLGDDTFRQYLRELEIPAPSKVRNRDAQAHFRALVELKLGGLLIANRAADGDLFGYYIRKKDADEYLKKYRKAGSDATARSRTRKPGEKED